jgi:hypothetical protein
VAAAQNHRLRVHLRSAAGRATTQRMITPTTAEPWTKGVGPLTLAPAADGPNRWGTFAFAPGGRGALTRFEPGPSPLPGGCRRQAAGSLPGSNSTRHNPTFHRNDRRPHLTSADPSL